MFIYHFCHRLFFVLFLFCFYCFGEMCWWDSQSAPCSTSFWSIQEHKWQPGRNLYYYLFIYTHCQFRKDFDCESATTMGECLLEQQQLSWLKAVPNNEFDAQRTLCKSIGIIWCKPAGVAHKIRKTPVSF